MCVPASTTRPHEDSSLLRQGIDRRLEAMVERQGLCTPRLSSPVHIQSLQSERHRYVGLSDAHLRPEPKDKDEAAPGVGTVGAEGWYITERLGLHRHRVLAYPDILPRTATSCSTHGLYTTSTSQETQHNLMRPFSSPKLGHFLMAAAPQGTLEGNV